MYYLIVYLIICVCVTSTFENLSTKVNNSQKYGETESARTSVLESSVVYDNLQTNNINKTNSINEILDVNITATMRVNYSVENNEFNETIQIDENLQCDNMTDDNNFNKSFQLVNLTNLNNESSLESKDTESSNFTLSFQLINLTNSNEILQQSNDSESYNFTEYIPFINSNESLEQNNYTESIKFTDTLQFTNVTESSDVPQLLQSKNITNFTKSDQFTNFKITSLLVENLTLSNDDDSDDLKNIDNSTRNTENEHIVAIDKNTVKTEHEHIVVKRETDASFQREIDEFDEEAINNQTKIMESTATNESTPINANSESEKNKELEENTANLPDVEIPTEEATTTEGPTVYPYTSEDGLIDVVADNGIKYISSESDNFPQSGEQSGNLAGITDDSEPIHYIISGESNLSEDSRKEVGIEDLLPDYVKPTVSGESENNDIGVIETATSSEEIVLSESEEEEPTTTTTTEAVTWLINSREYKGEKYESKEDDSMKTPINQTKLEDEDTSLNMEYRDDEEEEEETQISKYGHNNSSSNITDYNINKITTKYNSEESFTLQFEDKKVQSNVSKNNKNENQFEEENVETNLSKNNKSEKTSSEQSEYDPWGSDTPSLFESVAQNSIDLDEVKRNGEQVELIEMSFDSSSNNLTDSTVESDQIANANFTFKNIELDSSDSDDESEHSANKSEEDYDVENTQTELNNKNITYENSENVFKDINKTDMLKEIFNQTTSIQSNENSTLDLPILNIENITKEESNNTSIASVHVTRKHISQKGKNKHSKRLKKNISKRSDLNLNFSKDEQNIKISNSTARLNESDMYKVESNQEMKNNYVRHKRGILKNVVEHTTPYHWPQNSRENHGELFESNEDLNSTKSEDYEYFRASGHYSDYDDYSGKDLSIYVIDKNSSDGVNIFVTKKNSSNADLQKEYNDFKNEFKNTGSDEMSHTIHRRDVEEKLLKRYVRFQKEQSGLKQNFDDTPVTNTEFEEMLSKLFVYKLMKLAPKTNKYASKTSNKFIFKKEGIEENVNSKPYKLQKAYKEFMKLKTETNEIIKAPYRIKTNLENGNYIWNKTSNRLEKISN